MNGTHPSCIKTLVSEQPFETSSVIVLALINVVLKLWTLIDCNRVFKMKSVVMSKNKGLAEQDLSKLDVAQLHPLSPEVISRQATINIGIHKFLFHWVLMLKKLISRALKAKDMTMLSISQEPLAMSLTGNRQSWKPFPVCTLSNSRVNWSVTLPLNLVTQTQRFTNVKNALDQ